MSGGRTTFESGGVSLPAFEGSCTGPVTSTFLFTFAEKSDCDGPPSMYIVAEPPSALLRTKAVPPSVVFACTTQPVSVDLGASAGCCCAGAACSCANTPTAPASVQAAIVEVIYRMTTPLNEFPVSALV